MAGAVRWCAVDLCVTGQVTPARFALLHGPGDRPMDYTGLLGARVVDEIVPGPGEPAMTGAEAGHHGPSVGFEDFCERWEWDVRALVSDASAAANRFHSGG